MKISSDNFIRFILFFSFNLTIVHSDIKSLDGRAINFDISSTLDILRVSETGLGLNTQATEMLDISGNARVSGNLSMNGVDTVVLSNPSAGTLAIRSNDGLISGTNNTVFGVDAFNATSTGNQNTAIGFLALSSATTSVQNTAIGFQALRDTTTGSYNIGIGYDALRQNTDGQYNIAIGYEALEDNSSGAQNIAIGYRALDDNSTQDRLVAIGHESMRENTSGEKSVAVGYQALKETTDGDYNTAIGYEALEKSTNDYNTAVGSEAMGDTTSGEKNAAFGRDALKEGSDPDYTAAFGYQALRKSEDDYNVAIGAEALENLTSGSHNISIGYKSAHNGAADNSGSYNIIIGSQVDLSSDSASNEMNIGDVLYGTNMYNTGLIGINNNSPTFTLDVTGNAQFSSNVLPADNGTANLGSATKAWDNIYSVNALNVTSDKRMKKNIHDLQLGLDAILSLRPVTYELDLETTQRVQMGLIAQETKEVIDSVVNTPKNPNEMMSIRYSELVPVLIKAIQDQQKQYLNLSQENKTLKQRITQLELQQ